MRKPSNDTPLISVSETVKSALDQFLRSSGHEIPDLGGETDLLSEGAISSDEGVDFAIDLSDALGIEVPHDFNPFVHESGHRGRKFRELVEWAERFVANAKENNHAG